MSSRNKKSLNEVVKVQHKHKENSWVILASDLLVENNSFSIISLPHPANGTPTNYCLDSCHKKIYEIVTYSEPFRSWFIEDTVKSDGSLLMMTPLNPIFLILPKLRQQCINRAVPLDDLLSEKGFDKLTEFVTQLDKVADLKGPEDLKAYKYNEEKTLSWLEDRVRKVAAVLRKKDMHVTSGAVSATFVSSNINNDNVDEEFYLKYAHDLISEYLQDDLIDCLEKRFSFKPVLVESVGKKRKSNEETKETSKKIKCETDEQTKENDLDKSISNSVLNVKKQKPLSAKEKARQKAAAGTKTISAFFNKK